MKKLLCLGLAVGAVVAFVGADVIGSAVGDARDSIRTALTKDVPLETRLAEAKVKIDAYAENIIDGEVAAANMKDMIADTKREVRALTARANHERKTLVALRAHFGGSHADGTHEVVPTAYVVEDRALSRDAMVHVRTFKATSEMLTRRQSDLVRLEEQYQSTLAALEQARTERMRLSEEARVLEAEIESMNARKAAAQTRKSVGDHGISSSGYAEAEKSLKQIRNEIRKQNKLLKYYETRYELEHADTYTSGHTGFTVEVEDPAAAIEEALASYPSGS
ncbi:MAG: hypothetical protein QNJ98_14975 [Planctomycetota bacterium]|nr:hypothetical protein [Planctomycetota bacterium]